jgi:predicted transposase YbfD/YdcC
VPLCPSKIISFGSATNEPELGTLLNK